MRGGLIGIAVAMAFMAMMATRAEAADVYGGPSPYAPAPPPVAYGYRWAGPYVGANFGYQWGTLSNSGARPSGIAGGLQGGYNWQFGQFVIGGEADFQLTDADDRFANYKFS